MKPIKEFTIDYYIPPTISGASNRLAARYTVVFMITSLIILVAIGSVALIFNLTPRTQILAMFAGSLIQGISLFLFRMNEHTKLAVTIYLSMICFALVLMQILIGHGYFSSSLQNLLLLFIFALVIQPDKKHRFFLSFLIFGGTFCAVGINWMGWSPNPSASEANYFDLLIVGTIARASLILFCVYFFNRIRKASEQELEEQLALQARREKMDAISEIVKATLSSIKDPLSLLADQIDQGTKGRLPSNVQDLSSMVTTLEIIKEKAKSLLAIHRAYQNDIAASNQGPKKDP